MKVVDSNIFIAGILKDGKIRELIANSNEELLIPEIVLEEVEEHKDELIEKSNLEKEEFNNLISRLKKYFKIVPIEEIISYKQEADSIIGNIDKDDVLFFATSLAFGRCPIWSDDLDLKKQKEIKVYSTKEIIESLEFS